MLAHVFIDQRNSIYVGNLGPIPLFLHWSFIFLLFTAFRWSSGGGQFDMVQAMLFAVVLLSAILLHEMGHGMAARAYGAVGVKITLWAFGGLCSSTRDRLPGREIVILAAGPVVSFLLAWFGVLGLQIIGRMSPETLVGGQRFGADLIQHLAATDWRMLVDVALYEGSIVARLLALMFTVNLLLGIFNIFPIYPLDGGQIVHNGLSMAIGERRANKATLVIAFIAAIACFAYFSRPGDLNIHLALLLSFLLFNAYSYLR